uniref:B30.2/SPRY domain-containing protein n=1 Tax=Oryzias melastigma TaxID=30732 RepID=A0A3B3DRV9_ORYME
MTRKGDSDDRWFGFNDQSWSLFCSDDDGYSVWHRNEKVFVPSSSPSSSSHKVAVYVDYPAGILSFFEVSSDTLIHLHTFYTTFTGPLYPGFGNLCIGEVLLYSSLMNTLCRNQTLYIVVIRLNLK